MKGFGDARVFFHFFSYLLPCLNLLFLNLFFVFVFSCSLFFVLFSLLFFVLFFSFRSSALFFPPFLWPLIWVGYILSFYLIIDLILTFLFSCVRSSFHLLVATFFPRAIQFSYFQSSIFGRFPSIHNFLPLLPSYLTSLLPAATFIFF